MWTIASPTSVLVSMQLGEHEEERRQQRLVGDDQRQQQEDEDEFLARHREARQRVAGGDRQHQAKTIVRNAVAAAVEEIGRQTRLIAPKPLVAVEAEMVGEIGRRDRGGLGRSSSARPRIERTSGASMNAQMRQADGADEVLAPAAPRRREPGPRVAARAVRDRRLGAHQLAAAGQDHWTMVKTRMMTARISDSAAP